MTRYRQKSDTMRTEIFILRGTEAKASEKDPGISLETKPETTEQKYRKVHRGKRTYEVPVD